jgi:redox-sensitive bicupin YhaK (pirin superfamily)
MYAAMLQESGTVRYDLPPQRNGYVHVVKGELNLSAKHINSGGKTLVVQESEPNFSAREQAEFLLFDLP